MNPNDLTKSEKIQVMFEFFLRNGGDKYLEGNYASFTNPMFTVGENVIYKSDYSPRLGVVSRVALSGELIISDYTTHCGECCEKTFKEGKILYAPNYYGYDEVNEKIKVSPDDCRKLTKLYYFKTSECMSNGRRKKMFNYRYSTNKHQFDNHKTIIVKEIVEHPVVISGLVKIH